MGASTAAELESVVRTLMDRFDALDMEGIAQLMADDVQGVDEISRAWIRGKSDIQGYFAQLQEMGVTDVKTSLSDSHASSWGDTGLVTLMADQTYSAGGEHQHVVAPMTVVLRRDEGAWKIVLVSAVPLPEVE